MQMTYFCTERYTLSKTTLLFSKTWTLLVYGVSSVNHLSFNPTKCKFMVLSHKEVKTTPPLLNLLGSVTDRVDSIKYLGLIIKNNHWKKNDYFLSLEVM